MLLVAFTAFSTLTKAQTNELVFQNVSLYSGSAGADNAVYRFPNVNANLDALVKITGRSSAQVELVNIDVTNSGFNKAFQPQVEYGNGSVSGIADWWMEFEIKFVNQGTTTAANIAEAYATAIDIDGNGGTLREWDSFYGSASYVIENNTPLVVSTVTGILAQLNLTGKKFLGINTAYTGIDTSVTALMTTHHYLNTNTITIRFGATTTGANNTTDRMYSVWFKNFAYNSPLSTLPVKLTSFTATLNSNKVDLKWITESEINTSHFVVERSTDGTNFSEAGIVFAYGTATDKTNYSFPDNISNITAPVIYYRLKSVDNDGKSQYSETRIIRLSKQTDNKVTIVTFPNPVTNEVRISIPNEWQNKKVIYEIINANGQVTQRTETISSSQTESINASNLSRGFYVVRVSCEGQTAQQKIVKN